MAHFTRDAMGELRMVVVGNVMAARDIAASYAKVARNEYVAALEIFAGIRDVTFGSHGYAFTADYLKLPPMSAELKEVARVLSHAETVFRQIASDTLLISEAISALNALIDGDDMIGEGANPHFHKAYEHVAELLIDLARIK